METENLATVSTIQMAEYLQPDDQWINSAFIISQNLLLSISIIVGLIALVSSVVEGCRNSLTLIIILLCGMLLEVYCSINTYKSRVTVRSTESQNVLSQSCEDFHSPSLLANGVILLTLTQTAVKLNIKNSRRQLSFRNSLFVFVILVCIGLVMLYAESKHTYTQDVLFQSEMDRFFLSICEENVKELWLLFILETSLLYIPILLIMMIVRQVGHDKGDNTKGLRFIQPCHSNASTVCRTCRCLESTYQDVLYFYGIVFLVIRPAMFLYSYFTGGMIRDVLPSFAGVVQYLVLSLKYCYVVFFTGKESTINKDSNKVLFYEQQTQERHRQQNVI